MPDIEFEECAVAFIDILGFSSLVCDAASDESKRTELTDLVALLQSAIPKLDKTVAKSVPARRIPKHIYISDCVILVAPLKVPEASYYSGLDTVALRCIQLTHQLLKSGYLIRGGIATGKVWIRDSNIVGPAYQDAYDTEQKAGNPCIQLHQSAIEEWKTIKKIDGENITVYRETKMEDGGNITECKETTLVKCFHQRSLASG